MNMLFYGKPGLGKTSAARAIVRLVDTDSYELNGSKEPNGGFVYNIEILRVDDVILWTPKDLFY
jgi:hypothetical protein